MSIIIQKFGGSSLTTKQNREKAISRIKNAIQNGFQPVVVVSALGRRGDPYATDTLLELAQQESSSLDNRSLAFLLSCGECISAALLCLNLIEAKIPSLPLNGSLAGIITSGGFLDSSIEEIKKDKILSSLNKGYTPVITGFQGVNKKGELTTLGRGGSDITAVAIGSAIKAERVEIFTDVAGLMTADPKIVPAARQIKKVSYFELLQMAQEGAKIIHPRAVELAQNHKVPLVISSSTSKSPGTVVTEHEHVPKKIDKIITGITYRDNLIQVITYSNPKTTGENMFNTLAKNSISIDLINIFPEKNFFTIVADNLNTCLETLKKLKVKYEINQNLAKITIVGARMQGVPGVMSRIVSSLSKNNITILQTSDSHINISLLVKEQDLKNSLLILHDEFDLDRIDI